MLNELHYPFTIVGLTETKLNISKDSIDNIDLPGYQFLSQPSLSNAGGAGIFVQDFVKVSIRPELTKSEPGLEALWIEVLNDAHSEQRTCHYNLRKQQRFKPVFKTNRCKSSFITHNSQKLFN